MPGGPDEEEPRLPEGAAVLDELVDVALGGGAGVHQLRPLARRAGGSLEGGDLAVLVARRDARRRQQAGDCILFTADAGAGGPSPAVRHDDPPPPPAFRTGIDARF